MQTLRHMALGICLLCAAAGMIRIFWPDNQFKPVINTVLVLYIITSVLQMRGVGTWRVPELNWQDPNSDNTDYREYAAQLAQEAYYQVQGHSHDGVHTKRHHQTFQQTGHASG